MKHKSKLLVAISMAAAMCFSVVIPAGLRVSAAGEVAPRTNVYSSDYDSRADLSAAASAMANEISAEGTVLLKNEDNALPLGAGAKITILGKNSNRLNLALDLQNAGFQVNNDVVSFYNDNNRSGSGVDLNNYGNTSSAGYATGETPQASYTSELKGTFKNYNDAALVVFYRVMREGMDGPRTMMWDGKSQAVWTADSTQLIPGARAKDDHYLQLDQNETELLAMASESFEKVVVLLATPSTFEMGFLDDTGHYAYQENIKAALFITNNVRTAAVADILLGKINPSGHVTSTWARDFKLDPTWQNFGNYLMEVDSAHKGNQYSNLAGSGGVGGGGHVNNYVTYNEGIYAGYRYYETRGFTEGGSTYTSATEVEKTQYLDPQSGGSAGKSKDYVHGTTTTSWDSWYNAHVVYPFGHGLSYTSFTQTLVSEEPVGNSALTADGTITLKVKVKNTGTVAGKEVVQVYYTAPYTAGGIEKSYVNLVAFEKTKLLSPDEEETLTLSFSVRDMASYDYSDANSNSFKGYEVEKGEYTIRLMKNAHDEISNVKYQVNDGFRYETDEATDNKIENRFDDVSEYITGELSQKYLSRNNWEGTWPEFNYRLTASEAVKNGLKEWLVTDGRQTRDPEADKNEPYYEAEMPTTGVTKGILLRELHGLDYDDPKWDEYLNQFTVSQLTELATVGAYCSGKNYPELGVRQMVNCDGPSGIGVNVNCSDVHYNFGGILLRGMSWNKDLAYRFGKLVGEDALWGWNDAIGGWYAPSVNIQRNQFCGRNGEYYGEEGLIGGWIAAMEIKGAQEKGLPVYLKHFAFNNSETNRSGLITWLNEQSMREIYLKPFEICVKDGKTLGIMSALNRVGTTWTGGSYELLTEILRNEWGFHGCVVTDSYLGDSSNLSNADQMIRAGGNLALGWSWLLYNTGTSTTVACLREAAHGILYAQAHSNALNTIPQGEHYPVQSYSGGLLERGIVGIPYSQSVANALISDVLYPDVDDSEIVYSVNADSALPAGLTLSEDGILSGIPTEDCNNYRFKIDATYASYTRTAEFTISIVGESGAIVYEADENLGTVYVGKQCTLDVGKASVVKADAEGTLPTCTYALANGSLLPAGLSLSSDGKITGTPSAVCENIAFSVTASADGFSSVTMQFKLSVHYEMTFSGGTLSAGKLGVSYMEKLPAASIAQGKITYTLKEESRLPSGLTLSSGGTITGTPRETVTEHAFTVIATAPYADPIEAEFRITIGLSFNENTLQNGKVGVDYTAHVDTAQGAGEIKYTLKDGSSLPAGLTLSENGIITGRPEQAGDFTFTIVANADGKVGDEITLTLHIDEGEKSGGGGCGSVLGFGGAGVLLAALCLGSGCLIVSRRRKEGTHRGEEQDKK